MIFVDYVLIAIVAVSVVIGIFRGFFRELLSVFGWILAIWAAWTYSEILDPYLGGALSATAKLWAGRIVIFVFVLMLASVINGVIGMVLKKTGMSGADRGLGAVFGFGRGLLLVGLFIIGGQLLQMPNEPWWNESKLIPFGTDIADFMRDYLEAGVDYLQAPPEDLFEQN